jgi:hypothetical protein
MDTLLGFAVVGVWIAISVAALRRAFGARSSSPDSSPNQSHRETGQAHGNRASACC